MPEPRIMVVLGRPEWTLPAIHLACAVVTDCGGQVILLQMVPVRHPTHLGTDLGYLDFGPEEQREVEEYRHVTSTYGVGFSVCVFQYMAYASGLVDAADRFEATAVFARLPRRLVPWWGALERGWVRRALSHRRRGFYSLEPPEGEPVWTPYLTLVPPSARRLPGEPVEPALGRLPAPQRAGGRVSSRRL